MVTTTLLLHLTRSQSLQLHIILLSHTYPGKNSLAATASRSIHSLLDVVYSQSATYFITHIHKSRTRSFHHFHSVRSCVVRVATTISNSTICNHLQKCQNSAFLKKPYNSPISHTHIQFTLYIPLLTNPDNITQLYGKYIDSS